MTLKGEAMPNDTNIQLFEHVKYILSS